MRSISAWCSIRRVLNTRRSVDLTAICTPSTGIRHTLLSASEWWNNTNWNNCSLPDSRVVLSVDWGYATDYTFIEQIVQNGILCIAAGVEK
jgi:hypothetical protein